MESYLERVAFALIRESGIPQPIREYRFCEERKWRCDFVWLNPGWTHGIDPNRGVILELEGGVFMKKSAHNTGIGISRDIEKYNEASLLGFTVIRATKYHIINGDMIKWLKRALSE